MDKMKNLTQLKNSNKKFSVAQIKEHNYPITAKKDWRFYFLHMQMPYPVQNLS